MAETLSKTKKKQWYNLMAPKQFGDMSIGETLVYDPQAMLGKRLSHNLMNLTNDIKRQNINIHFKVTSVEGDKAMTSIIGYQIIPSSVKRFVRRNSEKMDLSFACQTADNISIRVKPLVITKADVKGSVAAKVRNNIVHFLIKTLKAKKYDEIMNDLIAHKLQFDMRAGLNKIYPLKVCEIRYLGIEAAEKKRDEEQPAEEVKEIADVKQTEESKEEVVQPEAGNKKEAEVQVQ
jgi:small subunit ribosomal protein S3Ae